MENLWFPICQASLDRKYPTVFNAVFLNLQQTSGLEVSLSVKTFVQRIRRLETSKQQADVDGRALLQRRGLTEAVISQAEALLAQLTTKPDTPPQIAPSAADMAEAEAAMWAWYKEWSVIACRAIHDRCLLRSLGLLTESGVLFCEDELAGEDLVDNYGPPTIVDQAEAQDSGFGRFRSA